MDPEHYHHLAGGWFFPWQKHQESNELMPGKLVLTKVIRITPAIGSFYLQSGKVFYFQLLVPVNRYFYQTQL